MHLILFDIDGTILSSNGQAGRCLLDAMREVFGTIAFPEGYTFAGKTDPLIVRDLMVAAGFDDDEIERRMPAVKDIYFERVCNGLLEREKMTVFSGVSELLDGFLDETSVHLGLVTGNWERSGRAKLDCVGFNHYFEFGGFGDDGADRRLLPAAAIGRARESIGSHLERQRSIIIGDTLHDIDCAHANGMRVIAVATGSTAAEDLERAGADLVVETLEQLDIAVVLDMCR